MNKGMRKDSGIIAGIKKTVFPKRGVMRRGIRKVLSGVMALTIMATSIPLTGLTAYAAQIKGFEVSLQWASGSSAENLNWSSDREEERTVTMQINYRNNQGAENPDGFPAGGITIRVPGIGLANRSSVKRAEAVIDNIGSETTWNYSYEAATDTYVFTNTKAIDSETSFAGSFQIAWDFNSRETVNGYKQDITATLSVDGQSVNTNEIHFSFLSKEDSHTIEAEANALEGPDGLGENANDYYWARYAVKETVSEKARAAEGKYYIVTLPAGAELRRVGNGSFENLGGNRYKFDYAAYQNVYVAYPKDQFGGVETNQTFELYGTYLDTTKEVRLAQDDVSIIPNDYGFVYDGYLYWVGKGGYTSEDSDAIRKDALYDGQVLPYNLMAIARYPGTETKALAAKTRMFTMPLASSSEAEENDRTATPSEAKAFVSPDYLDSLPLEDLTKPEQFEEAAREARNRYDEELNQYEAAEEDKILAEEDYHEDLEIWADETDNPAEDDSIENELSTPSNANRVMPLNLRSARIGVENRASGAMDLYLCDDFIDITGPDGSFRQLGDEEYEMVDVTIPSYRSFTNANGFPIESGKYTAEIVLGTDRYGTAATAFTINEDSHTYTFPAGTNRFFIRIKNVTESLYINQFDIELNVEYHLNPDKPIMDNGVIRNNDGLIVEYNGQHHNTVFDDSYLGSDAERVRQRDLDTYGLRVQRWYYNYNYEADTVYNDVYVNMTEFTGGQDGYSTTATFRSEFYRAENMKGWTVYSLLPTGMTVDEEKLNENVTISGFEDEFGSTLGASELRDGFSLKTTPNYQGSGRTLITATFDYTYTPVNCLENTASASFRVPLLVSFDAVDEYGTAYVVQAEQIIDSDGKQSSAYRTSKNGVDDGSAFNDPAWKDINGDGNALQSLVFNSASVAITKVMATQIELKKFVSTPRTTGKYTTNLQDDGITKDIYAYFGHEYSYRLNLMNTGTPAKNVVIYDTLETGTAMDGTSSQWKGVFDRVDVSAAQELGLNPQVWYSESENPGDLGNSEWTNTAPSDPAKVKSIAVDFGDTRMKTSEDVYVEVFMTAPAAQESLVGKQTVNDFRITYNAAGEDGFLDSNAVRVKLDYPKGTVAIRKVDEVSDAPLTGYEFILIDNTGATAATITDSGMSPEEVKTGTYTLRETKAPQGYEKVDDRQVEILIGLNEIKIEDPRIPGKVSLVKNDSSDPDILLEGAVFNLYKEDGTLVKEKIRTDENGMLTVDDLEWGNYYLEEKEAPDGHYLYGNLKKEFTIGAEALTIELDMSNRSLGTVVLVKYDADQPDQTVAGAEYNLYTDKDKLIGTFTTDRNGRIEATGLEWGSYYFQEKTAAPGYELNPERIEFMIYKENVLETVQLETEDEEQTASVELVKYDEEDHSMKLSGAVYSLQRETADGYMDLGSYKTDASGKLKVDGLKFGTYKFVEIKAPEGYEITEDNEVSFTLNAGTAGDTIQLSHENVRKKGSLQLKKVDNEGVPVAGAVFDLYKDGELYLEELVTDDFGLIEVGSINEPTLEWGEYVLKETEAPQGYELSEKEYEFVIDADHVRVPVTVTAVNGRENGSVKLVKYQTGDKDTLIPGAVYGLYSTDGVLLDQQMTDENGEAIFKEIPWGAYYLQEISAPDPYVVSGDKLRFSINKDNYLVEQILEAEDEVKKTSLTITKEISTEDVYDAYGNPTFMYRIEGKDGTGKDHVWYRQITLDEGHLTGSVTLNNIEASDANGYLITELGSIRYELESIHGTNVRNENVEEMTVVADLYNHTEAEVTFRNRLDDWQKFSHSTNAVNVVKKARTLTYLQVEYTGPQDISSLFEDGIFDLTNRDFLEEYLTVTAFYDVEDAAGNISRVLDEDEYVLNPGKLEGQGTAAPYTYDIEVSYTEHDTTRSGNFQVEASVAKPLYTITYHNPSGKNTEAIQESVRYGTITLLRPQAPAGYEFGGWYENAELTGTSYEAGGTFSNNDKSLVDLYAKWNPVEYTITYNLNGGSMSGQRTTYNIESLSFVLQTPSREGYEFVGWTGSNGSTVQTNVTIAQGSTGNKSYTANWSPITYTITYNLDGGSMSGQRTSYTVETASFKLPTPTKNGYTFEGWVGSNGWTPQTSVTVNKGTTGNLSYTARWNPIDYTITYNLNGGSMSGQKTSYNIETSTFTLPPPTRNGYEFTGWTGSNGTTPQKTVTITRGSTGNRTYTANWKQLYGVLMEGADFNAAVKRLSTGASSTIGTVNTVIKSIQITTGAVPAGVKTAVVSDEESPAEILAYFDQNSGCLYLSCPVSDIRLNAQSYSLFQNMDGLTYIDMRPFDTSGLVNASGMFSSCDNLTGVNLSQMNTQNVTSMSRMFADCKNLSSLDLSSFNTGSVTSMYQMFYNDEKLTSVKYGSGFVYRSGCDTGLMFYHCPANKPAWNGTWTSRGEFTPS